MQGYVSTTRQCHLDVLERVFLARVRYTVHDMTSISDKAAGSLGDAVRRARLRAGLTQAALAAACGLARQTIVQLESGRFSDLGIRKVERVLAQLGLRLRVEAAAAAAARTRIGRLLRARGEARRRSALRLASAALRALAGAGVKARLVGSLPKGTFRADSDVDFLVESRGRMSESDVIALLEAAMHDMPFDVVFAERADPALLELMRKEAKRGASAVRAP